VALAEAMGEPSDDIGDLGFDQAQFESLETEFETLLTELGQQPVLERFRLEYETLYRALKKSHESEKRLVKKCRELAQEISNTQQKTASAVKLSQNDQNDIASLKNDILRISTSVESSLIKEKETREELSGLKDEIEGLRVEVKQGASGSVQQETRLRDLTAQRDDTIRERDATAHQLMQVRNDITELGERLKAVEAEKVALDLGVAELKKEIDGRRNETEKERRRKEREEVRLKELKVILDKRQADVKQKQSQVARGAEHASRLEIELREQKQTTDRALKEVDLFTGRVSKLGDDLKEMVTRNGSVATENATRASELAAKLSDISSIRTEAARMAELRDKLAKRIADHEATKHKVDGERDALKVQVGEREGDIAQQRRLSENERKMIDDLVRERDILNKNLVKAQNATATQVDLTKINENTARNLKMEIEGFRTSAAEQARSIKKLTSEKERYAAEASEAADRYAQALDAVKEREISVLQLQKKIAEGEARLKQQQNLYEAVRSDRNLYAKNLIESQDEIAEMKRKFKVMTRQIEQLKEEIQSKDTSLVREHFEHMKVAQEKEQLKEALAAIVKKEEDMAAEEGAFKAEVGKLNQIISEAEAERLKQQKEFEIVVSERDILGTQLIRRNDELARLYEKIKLQQCTLSQGERAYAERLADFHALQKDMTLLRSELFALKSAITNLDALKNETFALQRDLLHERTKVRALSEELDNRMNVHRWRKLEGSDPNTYSMIQRAHALQKTLIRKTEEVAAKDALIQQKEKLYVELRAILARQPGPEVAEQLNLYQANLAEKTKQLKAMNAELNLHRQQVSDLKLDQENLISKLAASKKRYFASKMRQRTSASADGPYDEMGGAPTLPAGYEGAGSYDLSDFTAAPGTADFGDFGGPPPDGDDDDGAADGGAEPPTE